MQASTQKKAYTLNEELDQLMLQLTFQTYVQPMAGNICQLLMYFTCMLHLVLVLVYAVEAVAAQRLVLPHNCMPGPLAAVRPDVLGPTLPGLVPSFAAL